MVSLLEMLEQMASSSSGGSSLGSSVEDFFSDTPSTVTDNIPIKAEAAGIADFGLSQAEMDEFGSGGITTDIGEEHDITISGGKEAGWKSMFDDDNIKGAGKILAGGLGKGPIPVDTLKGKPAPELSVPASSRGYRPTESPYGIPSELASQQALQDEISKRIAQQLEQTIVKRPYLNFQGLI